MTTKTLNTDLQKFFESSGNILTSEDGSKELKVSTNMRHVVGDDQKQIRVIFYCFTSTSTPQPTLTTPSVLKYNHCCKTTVPLPTHLLNLLHEL